MRYFFFIFLLLFSLSTFAQELPAFKQAKGLADVTLTYKKRTIKTLSAIIITKNEVIFEAVDDFGNTPFAASLNKKNFKKVTRLPMNFDDFSAILLMETCPSQYQNAKITIEADHFKTFKKINYPLQMVFKTKKGSLTIQWKNIELS
ncbi:hypothetical protein K1X76_01680 [bacterium]|nr:hypothetical protein [bacterium]